MKKRKHIRKLISLLLVMALMSTCLGVSSVSASSQDPVVIRGCCVAGKDDAGPTAHMNCMNAMNQVFKMQGASTPDDPTSPNYDPDTSCPHPYYFIYNSGHVNDVKNKIQDAFAGSNDNDINYLYIIGHGSPNANCMNLGGTLYYGGDHGNLPTLKSILDAIPGHFIVFINACYSGQAINRDNDQSAREDAEVDAEAYSREIMENFFGTTRNGELSGTQKYTVFCAADSSHTSHGWNTHTYATYAWAKGLGWMMNDNGVGGHSCSFQADLKTHVDYYGYSHVGAGNADGVVTAEELKVFTFNEVHNYLHQPESPCYYSMCYFHTIATIDYSLGDVNGTGSQAGDGEITSQDVTRIQNYVAGNVSLTSRQKKLANLNGSYDANGVDTITMKDVLCLQKYLMGYPVPAPSP